MARTMPPAPSRRRWSSCSPTSGATISGSISTILYFNVGRISICRPTIIFAYIVLVPTIVAGKITLGLLNQILNAFDQVRPSFQYLVNSWTTIVELLSIYKRLRGFEAAIARRTAAVDRNPGRAEGDVRERASRI